jgi:hypothetical protein
MLLVEGMFTVWVSMILVIRVGSVLSFSTYCMDQFVLAGVAMLAAVGIVMEVEPADKLEVVGAGVEMEAGDPRAAVVLEVNPADPVLNEAASEVEAAVEEAGVEVVTGVESAVDVRAGVIVLREAVELRAADVLGVGTAETLLPEVAEESAEVFRDAGGTVGDGAEMEVGEEGVRVVFEVEFESADSVLTEVGN